jgi:formate dehydrogenase subunit delta
MSGQPVLRLAGDLADQFRHRPRAEAAAAIAGHIRMFWDPQMRTELSRQAATADGAGDPLILAAVRLLDGGGR